MRYGNPSIKSRLNKLKEEGCENIVTFTFLFSTWQLLLLRFVMKFRNNANEMATKPSNYSSLRKRTVIYWRLIASIKKINEIN